MESSNDYSNAQQKFTQLLGKAKSKVENYNPKNINWSHVGDLGYIESKLNEQLRTKPVRINQKDASKAFSERKTSVVSKLGKLGDMKKPALGRLTEITDEISRFLR